MANEQDIFAEQEALKRRRALMDAMTAQNMQTPIVGNTGLGQALTKLATAYVLRKGQNNVDQEATANRDRYNTELSSGLSKYLAQRNGTPAHTPENTMSDFQDQGEAMPGDPRAAILGAMTSKFPELQNIGKAEFAQLGKQEADYKEHVTPDGTVIRTRPGKPVENLGNFSKPKDQYSDPYLVDGPEGNGRKIMVKRNLATNEVEPVDKGVRVTNNVDMKGTTVALQKAPEALKQYQEQVIDSARGRQQAEQLLALAKDPQVITGFGAGAQTGLASIGAKLGITGPDSAAKTQSLVSAIAAQTLEASKELKGSISEKEKPFLEQAKAGQISYTPEAIQHLAGLSIALNHNRMLNGVQGHNSVQSIPGAENIGKLYPLPQLGDWALDPSQFKETTNGRVQFVGGFSPSALPSSAKKPTVSNW